MCGLRDQEWGEGERGSISSMVMENLNGIGR